MTSGVIKHINRTSRKWELRRKRTSKEIVLAEEGLEAGGGKGGMKRKRAVEEDGEDEAENDAEGTGKSEDVLKKRKSV